MYDLKKIGKVFTSKSVGTGPTSYEKKNYRAAVSQRLTNTDLEELISTKVDTVILTPNLKRSSVPKFSLASTTREVDNIMSLLRTGISTHATKNKNLCHYLDGGWRVQRRRRRRTLEYRRRGSN